MVRDWKHPEEFFCSNHPGIIEFWGLQTYPLYLVRVKGKEVLCCGHTASRNGRISQIFRVPVKGRYGTIRDPLDWCRMTSWSRSTVVSK